MLEDPVLQQLIVAAVLFVGVVVWVRWPKPCLLDELLGPPGDADSPELPEVLGLRPARRLRIKRAGDEADIHNG
jgi:hypothetical protein